MEKIVNIAKDYTMTPGGRTRSEGEYSGEEFREKILYPAYRDAKKQNLQLVIILDGGYGYATSFLEEAFGGLARETKDRSIMDIKIISNEEPGLIEKVQGYMRDALKERGLA